MIIKLHGMELIEMDIGKYCECEVLKQKMGINYEGFCGFS